MGVTCIKWLFCIAALPRWILNAVGAPNAKASPWTQPSPYGPCGSMGTVRLRKKCNARTAEGETTKYYTTKL